MSSPDERLRQLEREDNPEAYQRALERTGATPAKLLRERLRAEFPSELIALSALPRPTAQQVANFAGFISCAHSWYKHLPYSGRRFEVYLSGVPVDYACSHYAGHPADFHVQHFGHLEYRDAYEREEPVEVRLPQGGSLTMPRPLLDAGGATVNPMLHYRWIPMPMGDCEGFHELKAKLWPQWEEAERLANPPPTPGFWQRLMGSAPPPQSLSKSRASELYVEHARAEHRAQIRALQEAAHRVLDAVYGELEEPLATPIMPWFQHAPPGLDVPADLEAFRAGLLPSPPSHEAY